MKKILAITAMLGLVAACLIPLACGSNPAAPPAAPTPTPTPAPPAYQTQWGSNGTADGQFVFPEGVAVDSAGNIYVTDGFNNRVQKFFDTGTAVTFVGKRGANGGDGTSGTGDGEFNNPYGATVDSAGNVYIADALNHRVQKFSSLGVFLYKWGKNGGDGTSGTGDGEFNFPYAVAVNSTGDVYVSDFNNNRVQKFHDTGSAVTFVAKWGSYGAGNGAFKNPTGLAVDSTGSVYVADYNGDRVEKFDSNGGYLNQWGGLGTGNGQFDHPTGIAIDSTGNIYVAEFNNNRVQKFSPSMVFMTKWGKNGGDGTSGSGNGEFNTPNGLAVDPTGHIYVADTNNDRVQKFTP